MPRWAGRRLRRPPSGDRLGRRPAVHPAGLTRTTYRGRGRGRPRGNAGRMVIGGPAGEAASAGTGRYAHDALLYDSPDQLVEVAAPFLIEGLAAGDAAVITTSPGTAALLRD